MLKITLTTLTLLSCAMGVHAVPRISIDGKQVTLTPPPILKDNTWFVPIEHFAKHLGVKVEYPEGAEMAILCGGTESEICVSLQFGDSETGAIKLDGVVYAQPAHIAEPFGFEIHEVSANQLEVIQSAHLAAEFTLPDLSEISRRLQDFRGKKTLLYIWGSW